MEETWKFITGHENYLVSNTGRVIGKTGREVKPYKINGHLAVRIDGEQTFLHRIVAGEFIENSSGLPVVNHKDGNPLNNCVDNLEWCTPRQNSDHARYILGSFKKQQKPVMCVETGVVYDSLATAADAVNGDRSAIGRCATGERKKHKGYHWMYIEYGDCEYIEKTKQYCGLPTTKEKDSLSENDAEKNSIKKLLFTNGHDVKGLASMFGITYQTMKKKMDSPDLFKIGELRVLSEKCGVSLEKIIDCFL